MFLEYLTLVYILNFYMYFKIKHVILIKIHSLHLTCGEKFCPFMLESVTEVLLVLHQ